MNRKNLTAAVLAGLAGVVGIIGSAQASLLSISEMFATGPPPAIFALVDSSDAVAQSLGINEPDTMTLHIIDVEEVPDIVGVITSSEKVQPNRVIVRGEALFQINLDSISKEGLGNDFVALRTP